MRSLSLIVGDEATATLILYESGRIAHTLINYEPLRNLSPLEKAGCK